MDATPKIQGQVRAVFVVDGLLTVNVMSTGRLCTRLLTRGDVVLIDGDELEAPPALWGWSIVDRAPLAVFDDDLLAIGHNWPAVLGAVLNRAAAQARTAICLESISGLSRVEDRLLALFSSFARGHGIVRPDGTWIRLAITHDALADLLGSHTPAVSLALRALTEQKLVRPIGNGWVLAPQVVAQR